MRRIVSLAAAAGLTLAGSLSWTAPARAEVLDFAALSCGEALSDPEQAWYTLIWLHGWQAGKGGPTVMSFPWLNALADYANEACIADVERGILDIYNEAKDSLPQEAPEADASTDPALTPCYEFVDEEARKTSMTWLMGYDAGRLGEPVLNDETYEEIAKIIDDGCTADLQRPVFEIYKEGLDL